MGTKIRKNRVGYEKSKVATYGEMREPGYVAQELPPVNSIVRLYQTVYTDRDAYQLGTFGRSHNIPAEGCRTEGGRERYWQVVGYSQGIERIRSTNNHMCVKCINPEIAYSTSQSFPVPQISFGVLKVKIDGYVADDGTIVCEDKDFYNY